MVTEEEAAAIAAIESQPTTKGQNANVDFAALAKNKAKDSPSKSLRSRNTPKKKPLPLPAAQVLWDAHILC